MSLNATLRAIVHCSGRNWKQKKQELKWKIMHAIQVCYELNDENKEREIAGLQEAMKKFNLPKGIIVTANQEERLGNIRVVPAWKLLS